MTKEKTETTELDFDARYSVIGHSGVAWRLVGYKTERRPTICYGEDDDGNEVEI